MIEFKNVLNIGDNLIQFLQKKLEIFILCASPTSVDGTSYIL